MYHATVCCIQIDDIIVVLIELIEKMFLKIFRELVDTSESLNGGEISAWEKKYGTDRVGINCLTNLRIVNCANEYRQA